MSQHLDRVVSAVCGSAVAILAFAACAGTAVLFPAAHCFSQQIQPEPEPLSRAKRPRTNSPARARCLAVPKKSAKKWQQLRAKRIAESQLRATVAASYDPASANLTRPADAAAASAALAIRAWLRLQAACGWQQPETSGEAMMSGGNVAKLTNAQEVALAGMFRAAYKTCEARVDPALIAEAVQPYTLDKFESRADLCCRALLEARARFLAPECALPLCSALVPERSHLLDAARKRSKTAGQLVDELVERKRAAAVEGDFVAASELKAELDVAKRAAATAAAEVTAVASTTDLPPIRIASLGGGPGNDAVGCLLFAALCASDKRVETCSEETPGKLRQLEVTVYDFCPGWAGIVKQVAAALPAVMHTIVDGDGAISSAAPPLQHSLEFALCDLQLPPSSTVNSAVMCSAAELDLVVCSYCCHESGAATRRPLSENLLRRLLQEMKCDAALLVIDLWEKSINEVAALIQDVGNIDHGQCGSFAVMRLGSSRDFPFKGLFAVKISD